jgi:hypothetical protein
MTSASIATEHLQQPQKGGRFSKAQKKGVLGAGPPVDRPAPATLIAWKPFRTWVRAKCVPIAKYLGGAVWTGLLASTKLAAAK